MRFLPGTSTDSTISHGPFFADRRVQREERCERFKHFLWNREKKTMCNRTGTSWIMLLVGYSFFVVLLCGMFYLSLYATRLYINRFHLDAPQINKLYLTKGASPGLTSFPNIVEKVKLPLIWFPAPGITANHYSKYLSNYFKAYEKAKENSKFVICDESNPRQPGKLCLFDITSMGPCSSPSYGYAENQPCFYLRLNKLQGWQPEYYSALPIDMPLKLQEEIVTQNGSSKVLFSITFKYIWVHCKPVTPYDAQHIGEINYYPKRGFYGDFYPYQGDKDYLPPLVAVQISKYDRRHFISLHCSAWAKNINQKGPMGRKAGAEVYFYLTQH